MVRLIAICGLLACCAAGADFAGSQACEACHASIYQSFMRTPMAQSSGRAGSGAKKERFDQAAFRDSRGKFAYRVGRDAQTFYFEFEQQGAKQPIRGRRQLEYFVGSGTAARSYLLNVDGFLYEAPVSYYAGPASWKAAPGYADVGYPNLTRPILPGCLLCHASRIQRIAGTQNAYASPAFLEGGVACERCHGPGSEHIATGGPMVNPAKLGSLERDSICAQCHLSGLIRVPKRGPDEEPLRPGTRLSDVTTAFVRAGSSAQRKVTSHVEDLAQSACKRASGEKLWCGTCHDPHSVPDASEKAAYFRAKCLSCHQASDCRAPQASRRANGDDCPACHMPRNPVTDAEHVVFTDHSIPKRPAPVTTAAPANAELVPFGGGEASPRDLGLAYAMVGRRDGIATYIERAFRLLETVAAGGGPHSDAQPLAYLAEFYRDRKDDMRALPLYQEVWRLDPTQYAAAAALGAYQMQRGNLEDAIRFWNQTLAISPGLVLVRLNLATALLRTGQADQAQAVLRKALEFNPSFQEAQDLLDRIGK